MAVGAHPSRTARRLATDDPHLSNRPPRVDAVAAPQAAAELELSRQHLGAGEALVVVAARRTCREMAYMYSYSAAQARDDDAPRADVPSSCARRARARRAESNPARRRRRVDA